MKRYVEEYIEKRVKEGLNDRSAKIYKKSLGNFSNYLEKNNLSLENIGRENIENYISQFIDNQNSTSLINQFLSSLKGFFNYVEEKIGLSNPAKDIPLYKSDRVSKNTDISEIAEIVKKLENEDIMEPRDRLILFLLIQYSISGANLCRISSTDVKKDNDRYLITLKNEEIQLKSQKMVGILDDYLITRRAIPSEHKELFVTRSGMPLQKPHITHIIKRMSHLLNLNNDSLVFFSKARKIKTRRGITEIIDSRYSVISKWTDFGAFKLTKVIDETSNYSIKSLRLYTFSHRQEKLIDSIKAQFEKHRNLRHPNIITFYDFKIIDSEREFKKLLITHEYLEGKTLKAYAGKMNLENFAIISTCLLNGLSYIHGEGTLHYNINPKNIFISSDKSDKSLFSPKYMNIGLTDASGQPILTLQGGNPFVAPEFIKDKLFTERSDIYSLGMTLFYLLTGNFLDAEKSAPIGDKRSSLRLSSYPERLIKILNKMVASDPSRRYSDVTECILQFRAVFIQQTSLKQAVNQTKLMRFDYRMEKEISLLKRAIISLKDKKGERPQIIFVTSNEKNDSNLLIDEMQTISSLNEVAFYSLKTEANSQARLLIETFIKKDESILRDNIEANIQNQKVSLFEHTFSLMIKRAPFVLVINDIDAGSLEFLESLTYIIKKQLTIRKDILFVLTCKIESKRPTIIKEALLDFAKLKTDILEIGIESLSKNAISNILQNYFERIFTERVLDYIFNTTKGGISKLIDLVNYLIEDKSFIIDARKERIDFSLSFNAHFKSRNVTKIDPRFDILFHTVAAYQKPIRRELLLNVINRLSQAENREEILKAILTFKEDGIFIVSHSKEVETIYFLNEQISSTYYQAIEKERKKTIHNAIAEELEIMDKSGELSIEIEAHFWRGENSKKVRYYLLMRINEAMELGFLHDALDSFDRLLFFFNDYTKSEQSEIIRKKIRVLVELCELDSAKKEIELAKDIVEEFTEQYELKLLLVKIILKEGKYKEAMAVIDSALVLTRNQYLSIMNLYMEIVVLKGSTLIQLGKYIETIDFVSKILKNNDGDNFIKERLTLENQLGLAHFYLADYQKAQYIFNEVLKSSRLNKVRRIEYRVLNNLGILSLQLCNFDESLAYYSQSLDIANKGYDLLAKSIILTNIAAINHRIGNLKKAQNQYREILDIYNQIGEIQGFEGVLLEMGSLYLHLGLIEEARNYEKKTEELSLEHSNNVILGYSYALSGDISRIDNNFDLSLYHYLNAVDIFKKYNQKRELCQIYICISNLMVKNCRIDSATDYMKLAYEQEPGGLFPDISLRLKLGEISLMLLIEPLQFEKISAELKEIEDSPLIKSDWELYFYYLINLTTFRRILGKYDESCETMYELINEMRRVTQGFSLNMRNIFFEKSEFGKFVENFDVKSRRAEFVQDSENINTNQQNLLNDFNGIIGKSEKIKDVLNLIKKASILEIPVLIEGESGTGKELVAKAIYQNSERRNKPFMTENCAAFNDALLEAELFGYKRGAFTDALSDRRGLVDIAASGTIFLDEIGDMSENMQKKLLRFIKDGEYKRVGDEVIQKSDIRIIAATNRNLKQMVENKTFRNDLYYQLSAFTIHIPPLRERKEDIPILVKFFIDKYNKTKNENIFIENAVIESFQKYNWPGNIRELENEINRLIVICENNCISEYLLAKIE